MIKVIWDVVVGKRSGTKFIDDENNVYELDEDGDLVTKDGEYIYNNMFKLIGIRGLRVLEKKKVQRARDVSISIYKSPNGSYDFSVGGKPSSLYNSRLVATIPERIQWEEVEE